MKENVVFTNLWKCFNSLAAITAFFGFLGLKEKKSTIRKLTAVYAE